MFRHWKHKTFKLFLELKRNHHSKSTKLAIAHKSLSAAALKQVGYSNTNWYYSIRCIYSQMRCYSTQLLTVHNVTSCRSVGVSASGRSDSGGGGHQLYCSFRLVIRKCARHVMEQVRILQRRVAAAIGVVSSVLWVRERERGVWITMAGRSTVGC